MTIRFTLVTGRSGTKKYLKSSVMTIIVQVNGKLVRKLELPSDMDKQGVEAAALADENVQKFTNNKTT